MSVPKYSDKSTRASKRHRDCGQGREKTKKSPAQVRKQRGLHILGRFKGGDGATMAE
jgi:hypothetical protein